MELKNAVPSLVLLGVAGGLIWFARGLTPKSATEGPQLSAASAPPPIVAPAPMAVPASAVDVAPIVAPAVPVTAPPPAQAVPVAPAAPVAPPTESAMPAAPAVPAAAPSPVSPPPPSIAGKNPDDAPTRTVSGKVTASTNPDAAPAFGPSDALVDVLIISDYQCPVCKRAVDATHQIAEEFPGEVRVVFWNHALEMHRNAATAAAAGLAAQRQGKFWEMHDKLFENQGALDELSVTTYAEGLGLDMAKFKADMADQVIKDRVKEEGALAVQLEARGTPAFLINGQLQVGWGSWNGFRSMVERELTEAKAMVSGGTPHDQVAAARTRKNMANDAAFGTYEATYLKGKAAK